MQGTDFNVRSTPATCILSKAQEQGMEESWLSAKRSPKVSERPEAAWPEAAGYV